MGGGPTQGVVLRDTSGEPVIITNGRLLVDLSGTTITATVDISGKPVGISGQTVLASISGNIINTSGQVANISGQTVNISGGIAYGYGTALRSTAVVSITSASGGVFVGSGAAISVNLMSISGNAPIWIGSTTTPPVSGTGYPLYAGAPGLALDVNNVGVIKASAEASGNLLTYIANV